MGGKLKIREIARQTGVSISTVSRVLAGKSNISADSRQRVLDCARSSGVLEGLSPDRFLFRNVTVFAPKRAFDLRADIFYYKVIQGIRNAVSHNEVHLTYCALEETDADLPLFLAKLGASACDAALLIGIDDPRVHALAANFGKPCVLINCNDDAMHLDAVSPDHHAIGRFSAAYLVDQGHRDILTLICLRRTTLERRLHGIRESLAARRVEHDDSRHLIVTTGFTAEESREALAAHLKPLDRRHYPTAILAGGDFMASGAITALLGAGLSVPGDISVMSMDGFNLAAVNDLPLTAMHVPRDELGAEALRVLQQRIASPDAPFRHILLGGRLYPGGTVKRPTARKSSANGNRDHGLYGDLSP